MDWVGLYGGWRCGLGGGVGADCEVSGGARPFGGVDGWLFGWLAN